MLPLLGIIVIDGVNVGIQTSTILHLIPETETSHDLKSGIIVIVYGIGSLIGGYLGAKLCDKHRLRNVAMLGVIMFGLSCIGIFIASLVSWYPLTLLVCLFYGVQYCYIVGC